MNYIKERNKIRTYSFITSIISLSLSITFILLAILKVTISELGLFSSLLIAGILLSTIAFILLNIGVSTHVKSFEYEGHKLKIFISTNKILVDVDDVFKKEIKNLTSIKTSLIRLFCKRQIEVEIDNLNFILVIGAFNSIQIKK